MKEEIQKSYDRFCTFMEKNTLGTEILCYGVALTGLTFALRRVRPFSKFKKPSDVPNRFIKENKELIGMVERIEPNGALLMFEHKPPVTLPFPRHGYLPVKIAGVDVTGLGISWLQTIVAGNEVTCIPIKKNKNFVECTVTLQQKTANNKLHTLNIGESLVSINFAKLNEKSVASESPILEKYFGILKSAELRALKKKLGLKYYIKPTKEALLSIFNRIINYFQKQIPKTKKTPKLTTS